MLTRNLFAVAAALTLLTAPMPGVAQHAGGAAPPVTRATKEATQYDFLIGQWDLVVKPKATTLAAKIHGAPKLQGTWKAWRAFEGFGVEDELRISDASGNPLAYTHFSRIYDAGAGQWSISGLEVYRQRFTSSTAQWKDGEMVSVSPGVDADGKPRLTRTRVHKITPTSFRYQQDVSEDGGKRWTEENLVIEAKRVAAAAAR